MKSKSALKRTIEQDPMKIVAEMCELQDRLDKAERGLEACVLTLRTIKGWSYLNPPQWQKNVPANEWIWLRGLVTGTLFFDGNYR